MRYCCCVVLKLQVVENFARCRSEKYLTPMYATHRQLGWTICWRVRLSSSESYLNVDRLWPEVCSAGCTWYVWDACCNMLSDAGQHAQNFALSCISPISHPPHHDYSIECAHCRFASSTRLLVQSVAYIDQYGNSALGEALWHPNAATGW